MNNKKPSIRQRIGAAIAGERKKDFVPSLRPVGNMLGADGRTNNYINKEDQIAANVSWSYAANDSIAELCATVKLKLYRKKKDGDREEIKDHPILDLLDGPNNAHTGEQLRKLHHTYMNFTGEGYIYMTNGSSPFTPGKGRLPTALQVFESHLVTFKLDKTGDYSKSVVRFQNVAYPISAFIRDLNPNPESPYFGQSIIAKAASTIDLDHEMREWNRNLIANGAKPSLVFSTNEQLSDEVYNRWKQQFSDENTGTDNAGKPLLIEAGDAKPFMMTPQDLDFLGSRGFSRDEILAMWKTPLAVLGNTTAFNRANMDAALYFHILFNVVPRVRQFVKKLNQSFVKPFDSTFELDFDNPVPEDVAAKLAEAVALTNKVFTIDEQREKFGEKPLPNGLGTHIYMPALNTILENLDKLQPDKPVDPDATDPNEGEPNDAADDGTPDGAADKSLAGVKKKT